MAAGRLLTVACVVASLLQEATPTDDTDVVMRPNVYFGTRTAEAQPVIVSMEDACLPHLHAALMRFA